MTGKDYKAPYSSFSDIAALQDMLPFFVDFEKIPFNLVNEHNIVNAYWLSEFCRLSYITSQGRIKEECKKVNMDVEVFWNNNTEFLVAHDAEKVFVVARGTESSELDDIITDLKAYRVLDVMGEVHAGFKDALDNVWTDMHQYILSVCKGKKIYYTGHSLGAGLASIAAIRLGGAALYTFGSPRVGNTKFALYLSICINHHRYINQGDLFAAMPPPIFNWRHSGTVVNIKSDVFEENKPPIQGIISFFKRTVLARIMLLFTISKWALVDLVAEHNVLTYNNYLREQVNLPAHKLPKEYLDQVNDSIL